MAKSKPTQAQKAKKKDRKAKKEKDMPASPEALLAEATGLLHTGEPAPALVKARKALAILQPDPLKPTLSALPAINLLGEISVELGDAPIAREYFEVAASLDPDGSVPENLGGGAEKFMWLAQLSEEGGHDSVAWFEKGVETLRQEIAVLEQGPESKKVELQPLLQEKRKRLAAALCSVVEVYMTDLSWEEDAEARCEALVSEAVLVAPDDPSTLQTLANVRLSQDKKPEAQEYLTQSIKLWKDLEPEDSGVPDFPTRISLTRLLMEAGMEDEALEVLERLVNEDDSSVEAWYLGGWCIKLQAEKRKDEANGMMTDEPEGEQAKEITSLLKLCRNWLQNSMKLYQALEYEDERLKEHAEEILEELKGVLGEPPADGEQDDDEEEWEGISDDEDEEMEGT